MKRKQQSGFTLIELVVVIVILGILAATAIPKFVDLSEDAATSAAAGVAGALASGSSLNYAAKMAGKETANKVVGDVEAICTPEVLQPLLSGIFLVDKVEKIAGDNVYAVIGPGAGTDKASCTNNPGAVTACEIQGKKGKAVQASIVCTG